MRMHMRPHRLDADAEAKRKPKDVLVECVRVRVRVFDEGMQRVLEWQR